MLAHGTIDWNHVLNVPDIAGIIVAIVMGTVFTIWIVASQWRRVRVAESEAGLKIRLVERGYSVEDMERILATRLEPTRRERKLWRKRSRKCCSSDFLT